MPMVEGKGVKTFKDNFWSRKRVEAKITIKELADALNIQKGTLGAYFTGCLMPKEDTIHALCDWFNVDYIEGEREFRKAWKAYDPQRNGKTVVISVHTKETTDTHKDKTEDIEEERKMTDVEKLDAIARLLYKKVSYDEFCKLREMPFDKILETAYNRVDYTVFRLIENIINGKIVKIEDKCEI